jgi:glycine cleavage system transcriptional repressor
MAKKFIVSAYGTDRPGIVADVTEILYEYGCNLEETRMGNLSGDFSLMILFSAPEENAIESKLSTAYQCLKDTKQISAYLRRATAAHRKPVPPQAAYTLKIEGLDHTGIVYRISRYLACHSINIANLNSSITYTPESGARVYHMEVSIEVSAQTDMDQVREGLGQLAEELHVEIIVEQQPN